MEKKKLKINRTYEIPIHAEVIQTLKEDLHEDDSSKNLKIMQYCETSKGEQLIQYIFVPKTKLDEE